MSEPDPATFPWYREESGFFGPEYLIEYRTLLPPERTLREVDFVTRACALDAGSRVLDLACGHGRHVVELARRGVRVAGLDLSAFFLREARCAANSARVTAHWVRADMRRIPFVDAFDAVLCLFSSFGYLETEADNRRVVREVAHALRPGGRFVLDVARREWIEQELIERERREAGDGAYVMIERTLDRAAGRDYQRRVRFIPGREPQEVHAVVRHYAEDELIAICEEAGLSIVNRYGDYDGGAASTKERRLIIVAERRRGS